MRRLASVLLGLAGAAAAAAESPREFAYALAIEGVGGDALYRLALPQAVYETAAFADLRDLRVFNGADEVVPHAFRPVEPAVQHPAPVALPFFPLRASPETRLEDFELKLEKSAAGVRLRVKSPAARAGTPALRGYLIDVSALQAPLAGLALEWKPTVDSYHAAVRVEASDDLKRWTLLSGDAPLASLTRGSERLERKRIEYGARQSRYLRLTWADTAQALELDSVMGLPPGQVVQAERAWKQVLALSDPDHPGEYSVDVGGLFPLERLAVDLPQENSVVPLQVLSRAKPSDVWAPVARAVVYRLKQDGRELRSPDISIVAPPRRYWLLRADAKSGGAGAGPLTVRAGWTPREIVFATRGRAPFRLAYGNAKAQANALPIETLVPDWRSERAPKPAPASTGSVERLAGEAAAREGIDVRKWSLWGALVAGVALLGWMAWRLSRQIEGSARS